MNLLAAVALPDMKSEILLLPTLEEGQVGADGLEVPSSRPKGNKQPSYLKLRGYQARDIAWLQHPRDTVGFVVITEKGRGAKDREHNGYVDHRYAAFRGFGRALNFLHVKEKIKAKASVVVKLLGRNRDVGVVKPISLRWLS